MSKETRHLTAADAVLLTADEFLVATVHHLMGVATSPLIEPCVTEFTFVGFGTSVYKHMGSKAVTPTEVFLANQTRKWLFSSVLSDMVSKGCRLPE